MIVIEKAVQMHYNSAYVERVMPKLWCAYLLCLWTSLVFIWLKANIKKIWDTP